MNKFYKNWKTKLGYRPKFKVGKLEPIKLITMPSVDYSSNPDSHIINSSLVDDLVDATLGSSIYDF